MLNELKNRGVQNILIVCSADSRV
ncbi:MULTISPECIES: hypothetical protein [Enterococcus]